MIRQVGSAVALTFGGAGAPLAYAITFGRLFTHRVTRSDTGARSRRRGTRARLRIRADVGMAAYVESV